jgi:hypothetical protein
VAFSLAGIPSPEQSPVASLTLVQGAFSHWSFSDGSTDIGIQGALSGFQNRVKGPLCATYSTADWAVGNWYPKASFLSQQDNQDSDGADRWGGMGADGYRGVTAHDFALPLTGQEVFVAGEFHRADGNFVINDTSQSLVRRRALRHPETGGRRAHRRGGPRRRPLEPGRRGRAALVWRADFGDVRGVGPATTADSGSRGAMSARSATTAAGVGSCCGRGAASRAPRSG